jgi:hypothetical protein
MTCQFAKTKNGCICFATWRACNQYPLWVATWRVSLQKNNGLYLRVAVIATWKSV